MTDRELMQEALYALTYVGDAKEIYSDTIEALRARLAQPEQEIESDQDHVEDDGCPTEKAVLQRFWREHQKQEPVAWIYSHKGQKIVSMNYVAGVRAIPLYTAPPQQHSEQWWRHEVSNAYANGYEKGRASVKQPEPEPVAWVYPDGMNALANGKCWTAYGTKQNERMSPLYIAPPQREWQGLTDEEMMMVYGQSHEGKKYSLGRAIEAKLKEKNNAN